MGKLIRVFVASPGDVGRERDALNGVINELNRTCEALLGRDEVTLRLVRWETDTFPGAGRPQALINEQIGDYDIFVGILWTRVGTPSGTHESGTIEEFETAYARYEEEQRPYICLYFSQAELRPPETQEAVEQLAGVVRFRERLEGEKAVFSRRYDEAGVFADTIRPHLAQIVGRYFLSESRIIPRVEDGREDMAKELAGLKGTLSTIGPEDACYGTRAKYEGHTGVVIEGTNSDGWIRGTFRFDEPLVEGDNGVYKFFQFQVDAPPV